MKLTKAQMDALEHAYWCEKYMQWNITGSRMHRRNTLLQLESMGFLKDIGLVIMCDGDGHANIPEQYRNGWELTDLGSKVLAEYTGK